MNRQCGCACASTRSQHGQDPAQRFCRWRFLHAQAAAHPIQGFGQLVHSHRLTEILAATGTHSLQNESWIRLSGDCYQIAAAMQYLLNRIGRLSRRCPIAVKANDPHRDLRPLQVLQELQIAFITRVLVHLPGEDPAFCRIPPASRLQRFRGRHTRSQRKVRRRRLITPRFSRHTPRSGLVEQGFAPQFLGKS